MAMVLSPAHHDGNVKRSRRSVHNLRDDSGAALVEMAFVLPLLLLLVFGLYNFGRAYNTKIELTGAVREGARAAALGQTGQVQATVIAAAPGLDPPPSVSIIAACPAVPTPGAQAIVEATQPVPYDIPFFGQGTWNITARAVMRCGV
jgi:hypothetical protein